jgi:kynurenine formamidase
MVRLVERRQLMRTAAAGVAGMVGGQMINVGGAGAATETAGHHAGFSLASLRFVNLSHVNDPATTTLFPGDMAFTLETVATIPVDGFYMQYVREGEHTGTHWGAPGHFQEGGLLADQLDPADLYLPAVKIDVRAQAASDDDYGVTVADVKAWERRHGPIPQGAAIVFWFGWAGRWGTDAYANLDAEGVIHQPGVLPETVQWLIDHGRLAKRGSIGTDTFGADRGVDDTFEATTLLFDRHRISLENLSNLEALPTRGAYVLVGGPINKNGSGSTATIYGVLPPS